ncbi:MULTISPECIES: type IV secretion system protein [Sphingomonas]|uniref:type IV secretion system protein n=1 Tax=Sphingomonas TaxID=13687 RepID=UPI000DEFA9B3|nr:MULTISPECIES: type IV secretion system protein [Sphingomonas]
MNACPALGVQDGAGIAEALRTVDCVSASAAQTAFGRLFGAGGGLGTALTLLLTLYVGLLAMNLLTGRSRLGLSMLTPRMLMLGLVLTFATSWVAYQSVVWNLLTGAPDQIASVVTGEQGSATVAFAHRLDTVFTAVGDAAEAANRPVPVSAVNGISPAPPQAHGWTAGDVLWMAALLLLLGTVGVLLVSRIALAALLALGPVFIVMALFRGTHGLFVGWLKGAVMFALVPLFTVLIGGAALQLLTPVVANLDGGDVTMRAAVTMFLGACVYAALMAIVLKVSATMVAGWRIGGGSRNDAAEAQTSAASVSAVATAPVATAGGATTYTNQRQPASDRVRSIVEATRVAANDSTERVGADHRTRTTVASVRLGDGERLPRFASGGDRRVDGVRGRFRAKPALVPGKPKS